MLIKRTSIVSGITREKELAVTLNDFKRIEAGEHIQNVLPHLNDDEREFILTGITSDEWDALFSDENDGDEKAF